MGEWFGPLFVAVLAVGFVACFVVPICLGLGMGDKGMKVLAALGIVCVIALTIFIHNDEASRYTKGVPSGSSGTSHSCCICGASASNRYGNDWWCTKHYYQAKASEGDLSP